MTARSAPERVLELMERVAAELGVDARARVSELGDEIRGEYVCEEAGLLIGHHGQLLDAIGHLAYRFASVGTAERKRVVIDAGGYRRRREQSLRQVADQAVEVALADRRAVALEPMPAGERRIVHEYLKNRRDVETYSEGQEPARRLVVAPVLGTDGA